jgi:hypothetical protein
MKVKVTAHRGCLVIETVEPDVPVEGWVPIGPGKIGCIICNTAKNLGVSEEALTLLGGVKRSHDDIGDVDWWACDDGTKAFGWIGNIYQIAQADSIEGSRNHTVFRDACVIIPNDVPEVPRQIIDEKLDGNPEG